MTGIRLALLTALLATSSPLLLAQDSLERELDFVRALAERMRFIELAKGEVDRLAKEHRGAGDQDRIAQLSVQISYQGAKARGDRTVQRTLFKEAIEKSKELIDRSGDEKVLLQARATLADASQEFGQFLVEELELARDGDPENVKALEEEAATTFRAGIDACGKVMEELEPLRSKDDQKNVEYGLFWMRKGVLMREQARAVKADRGVLVDRAISELTDMVLDFGEETALGLRGLFEIAQCSEVAGDIDGAIDVYRGTISQIGTSLRDDTLDLPGDVQALLYEMLQEVYVKTAQVLASRGDSGTGALFEEFRQVIAEFGEKGVDLFDVVDPKWGHRMLLAEARFKAESGDQGKIADAIAMAQRINDKHPNDFTGMQAKATLGEILATQKSMVSGKLLFEIAKGELQNNNHEAGIKGLRRAIGAMSAQEAREIGLESWQMLGTAFAVTDRYLEAIIALGTGLQQFGDTDEDRASEAADLLDRAIGLLKRQTKNDALLNPTYDEYLPLIATYSIAGAGKIFYKDGNNALIAKDYQTAISKYRDVPTDFPLYETAQVRIAKAFGYSGDVANARTAIAAYRDYAGKTELDSRDSGKIAARQAALAEAEFLEALMTYWEARGNEDLNIAKTPTKYQDAIGKLNTFVRNNKDDSNDIPSAIEMLGRLHSDIGELDRAEEAYAQLKNKDALRASRLATEIFLEYQNQVKTLDQELADAIAKDKGEGAIAAAQKTVDGVRRRIGALGLDYIANSPRPQLAVLVGTMNAFESLDEWKRVDEIAQKTLELYGDNTDDAVKKVVDRTVRPMIGEAMLKQRKFTEAYKMLLAAEEANPTQWELKRQIARCLGGWFEFKNGVKAKEPGLDRPAEAYLKYYQDYRPWAERPEVKQFSLEWYRFQWECYWFAKQASATDSEYKARADIFYRKARATDNFETLKSLGPAGLELFNFFQLNR